MPSQNATRYCADPDALATIRRDGLGWGHDLDCGCFHSAPEPDRPWYLARIFASFFKRRP